MQKVPFRDEPEVQAWHAAYAQCADAAAQLLARTEEYLAHQPLPPEIQKTLELARTSLREVQRCIEERQNGNAAA